MTERDKHLYHQSGPNVGLPKVTMNHLEEFFVDAAAAAAANPPLGKDGKPPRDPRIRHQFGEYRVVCPNGKFRNSDGKFWANGKAILEKSTKDSLGQHQWAYVTEFAPDTEDIDHGMYVIMCNGAQDDHQPPRDK